MGTTADKLQRTLTTKNEISQAIEDCKGTVPEKFSDYPDAIRECGQRVLIDGEISNKKRDLAAYELDYLDLPDLPDDMTFQRGVFEINGELHAIIGYDPEGDGTYKYYLCKFDGTSWKQVSALPYGAPYNGGMFIRKRKDTYSSQLLDVLYLVGGSEFPDKMWSGTYQRESSASDAATWKWHSTSTSTADLPYRFGDKGVAICSNELHAPVHLLGGPQGNEHYIGRGNSWNGKLTWEQQENLPGKVLQSIRCSAVVDGIPVIVLKLNDPSNIVLYCLTDGTWKQSSLRLYAGDGIEIFEGYGRPKSERRYLHWITNRDGLGYNYENINHFYAEFNGNDFVHRGSFPNLPYPVTEHSVGIRNGNIHILGTRHEDTVGGFDPYRNHSMLHVTMYVEP